MDHNSFGEPEPMVLGVLMKAKFIPDGESVRKVTGSKEYTISNGIRVYDVHGKTHSIPATDGAKFIMHGASANVVSAETILVWCVNETTLLDFLNEGEPDQ